MTQEKEHKCITTNQNGVVATIGMFDGVHVGHKSVLKVVVDIAKERAMQSAVVTFFKHPQCILHSDCSIKMLMPVEDRIKYLKKEDIDEIILINFTKELSQLSADGFINMLHSKYNVAVLVVGYNHRFGHNREESLRDYIAYGKKIGVEVVSGKEYKGDFSLVSSSIIRRDVAAGDVETASKKLGKPFYLRGEVIQGFKNGRKLGFPTANMALPDSSLLLPQNGVYAVRVGVPGMGNYDGMCNIGVRPTLGGKTALSIEVNIFDFDADIYGKEIEIQFIKYIRAEKKMNNLVELSAQLGEDKRKAQEILDSEK